MNRVKRLQPVQRIADDNERRCAEKFALAERRVAQCEAKLAELEQYRTDYAKGFVARAQSGLDAAGLRDYQAFLARLADEARPASSRAWSHWFRPQW